MKMLYTFYWPNGKKEEPLQASSTKQALFILIKRYQDKNSYFDKFKILNSFRDGILNYKLDEPYQRIRQPNTPTPSTIKPRQMEFKDFLEKESIIDDFNDDVVDENLKSIAAAGLLGLGALTGTPNIHAKEPVQVRQTQQTQSFLSTVYDYIKGNEGIRLKPYKDVDGFSIGIGHKILPNEDFSNGITEEEAKKLFLKDIQQKLLISKRIFPNFHTYPDYLKVALVDGVFRGDHSSNYRTTKLINSGNFIAAANEYLNRNDYKKSKELGSGVHKRLEKNSNAIKRYGIEQQYQIAKL